MTQDEARQVENRTASQTRALVALAAATTVAAPRRHHRQAPFLAQLIATKQQHPQTRERRRAEPAQAVSAYRAAAKLAKWG